MNNKETTNARRFLESYNKLDSGIRVIFNLYPKLTFSSAIRKASEKSPLIRRYEDDLLSYAKLRNAIVHDSEEGKIIAEPLLEVVEEFERIVGAVLTPKKISQCDFGKKITMLSGNESVERGAVIIYESGFSNLPVFCGGKIIGIMSNKRIVEILAMSIKKGHAPCEILKNAKVSESVFQSDRGKYYEIKSSQTRIDEIIKTFEENPTLSIILITKNGKENQPPEQIVGRGDVVTLSEMLESY